jgi:hypothetical protein
MKSTKILLAALFAASCSPGGTPADGGGDPVVADKYCVSSCEEAADCSDDTPEDWACNTNQCQFIHYFDNGDFCADDDDCDMEAGGAYFPCETTADCDFGKCVNGIGDKGFCLFEPTGGTTCAGELVTADLPERGGTGNVTVCVGTGGTCTDGFCEADPPPDGGTVEEAETCDADDECEADEACAVPL